MIPELLRCCERDTVEPCGVPRSEPKSEEEFESLRLRLGRGGKNAGISKRSSVVPGVPGREGGREGGRDDGREDGREGEDKDHGEGGEKLFGDLGDFGEKMIVGTFGVAKG